MIPPTPVHTHTRTHLIDLDWSSRCRVKSRAKPSHRRIASDDVYFVWLLDRAIVSFTLPPPWVIFSSVTHILVFFLPPSFSHSAFRVASLCCSLLQLFLAGSCMRWLSLPHKQKTLREEWLEYRFVPQSFEFFFFFLETLRSPSKKCLYSWSLEAFQSLMCCNRDSNSGSKESSKKWTSSIKHTATSGLT